MKTFAGMKAGMNMSIQNKILLFSMPDARNSLFNV